MSVLLHIVVYVPVTMALGALAYNYRTKIVEAKNRVAARLKTLR